MSRLHLTLAMEHYDRHVPFMTGAVKSPDLDLDVIIVGQNEPGGGRHERMLKHRAYDVAELSLGSYVMAKARGAALTAIPVFPRRLFSQSQMYVNTTVGVQAPADLAGKRVALRSYQTTLSVLAKGDLSHEYGLPLEDVTWVTTAGENVSFTPPPNIRLERLPEGQKLGDALANGEVAAYLSPRPPQPFLDRSSSVDRLFRDPKEQEVAYFQKNGFYPIMHIVALKSELAEEHPWLPEALLATFEEAKRVWTRYYDDPNWSRLAWGRRYLEEERSVLGDDPWPYGVAANRANLERFISYEFEQGLIPEHIPVEALFAPSVRSS